MSEYPVFVAWPKDEDGNIWANGELNAHQLDDSTDWSEALFKVIPAWVKCTPESVAEYIQHLQGEIEHRRGPKR